MKSKLFLSLALLMWAYRSHGEITKCAYDKKSCSCESEEGRISLKSTSEAKEKYEIKDPNSDQVFYWNPCKTFKVGDITAGGIQEQGAGNDFDIGVPDNADTTVANGTVTFQMNAADFARSLYVKCECQPGFDMTFNGEEPQAEYQFTLKADACCPGHTPSSSGSEALSIGYILVIAFCVLLVVYIVAGIAIQVGVRKASGREVIPNIAFWGALPGLIKDGIVFTFTCGKRSTYSKI